MSTLLILALSVAPTACATPQSASARAQESVAEVFQRTHTGVVTLHTVSQGQTIATLGRPVAKGGTGAGVVISAEGDVLTAAHVVQTATKVVVEFYDGSVSDARIISSDPLTDLALVRLKDPVPKGVTVTKLGDSDSARIGDPVFAVGSPLGISHTLTVGYLSARRISPSMVDSKERIEVLQTDAALNPGNSGGPLFDMKGEIIGIVSYISSLSGGSEGLGFAISANTIRERFFERPFIWTGMEYISLRGRFAELLNVPGGHCGLLVQRVAEDSPAHRLGLRGGDILADIQGQRVLLGGDIILAVEDVDLERSDAQQAIRACLIELDQDDDVNLTILRGGRELVLTGRWHDFQTK